MRYAQTSSMGLYCDSTSSMELYCDNTSSMGLYCDNMGIHSGALYNCEWCTVYYIHPMNVSSAAPHIQRWMILQNLLITL